MPLTGMLRKQLPTVGGVYAFTDLADEVSVYVGKTGNLRKRIFDAHLNGTGRSCFRQALLGLKKTRNLQPATLIEELDEYIESNFLIRFMPLEEIMERGCLEDYLNAMLQPIYSVPLNMK